MIAGSTFDRSKAQGLVQAKTQAVQAKSPEVIAAKERHRMSDNCKGFDPSANVWWWIRNATTPRSDPHIAGEVYACADNEIASGYFFPIRSGQVLNAFL